MYLVLSDKDSFSFLLGLSDVFKMVLIIKFPSLLMFKIFHIIIMLFYHYLRIMKFIARNYYYLFVHQPLHHLKLGCRSFALEALQIC